MTLENQVLIDNHCLIAEQIREEIIKGNIVTPTGTLSRTDSSQFIDKTLEDRIQPSSYEPALKDEIFVLSTGQKGIFRPQRNKSIYRSLLELPSQNRQRFDISSGYEIKRGFTYLVPLLDKINSSFVDNVRSSAKSSLGRVFLNSRLLSDYNPGFDIIRPDYKPDTLLDTWLLIQPLAFNLIIYPGLTLNQLRFIKGVGAQFTPQELLNRYRNNPFLYKLHEGNLVQIEEPIIYQGLQMHLNLIGAETSSVVGLKARNNPMPIDLSKKKHHDAELYFEPVLRSKDDSITLEKGRYYLLSSEEIIETPADMNLIMESYNEIGFRGMLHRAGFIDNGFKRDLVFEVRSDEEENMELIHGTPINQLLAFRTNTSDKLYGEEIGSNYSNQIGPRTAKYFKDFDFEFAARNYQKLNRLVLVQDTRILKSFMDGQEGFQELTSEKKGRLLEAVNDGFFHYRFDCEADKAVLQIIPYVLVFGPDEQVFSYVRAHDIKDYGDSRLFGKHSVGLGGHVTKEDSPDYLNRNIEREVNEEVLFKFGYATPELLGILWKPDLEVDEVHFGLVYKTHSKGLVEPNESSISSGRLLPINLVMNDQAYSKKYETWSRVLIPHLKSLYRY